MTKNVKHSCKMKECKKTFSKIENLRSRSFNLDLWYLQHCNVVVEITDIKYDWDYSTEEKLLEKKYKGQKK